jgi:hypothetical protein
MAVGYLQPQCAAVGFRRLAYMSGLFRILRMSQRLFLPQTARYNSGRASAG